MNRPNRIVSTKFEGATHRYRLSLDRKPVEDAVKRKLTELSKKTQIRGFRRGKVPYAMIHNLYKDRVTESIVEQFAVNAARTTIREEKLRPVSRPLIESIIQNESGEYEFDLILEIYPHVAVQAIHGLKVRHLVSVPDPTRLEAVRKRNFSGKQASGSKFDHKDEAAIYTLVSEQLNQLSRLHLKRQVLDWLAESYSFDVPETMMARDLKRILDSHRNQYGAEPTTELLGEYKSIARRRIQLAIIILEIGRAENIRIPKSEIERIVRTQAERDPDHEQEIIDFYLENATALAELQSPLFEDYVIDHILKNSEVQKLEVPADQLVEEAGLEIEILS